MTAPALHQLLACAPVAALPGTWKLPRGRAISLRPRTDGVLRIAHGRVWATVEGPHGGTPAQSGDHVLQPGRSMLLRAGQHAVIEAWNPGGASWFAWDPLPASVPAGSGRLRAAGVMQPLADLRLALAMASQALVRLAVGLARLAWDLARTGGRAADNRPHAVRHRA